MISVLISIIFNSLFFYTLSLQYSLIIAMLWCLCYCSIQASELLKTTAVASRYFGVPGGDEEGMCVCVCVSVCDTVCVCVREREREREREKACL
jgi:hypothetical protein